MCGIIEVGTEFVWFIAFSKFFISAAMASAYVYTVEFYPTRIRSTGLGMAIANATIGSIVTPTLSSIISE